MTGQAMVTPGHLREFFSYVRAARYWARADPALAGAPDIMELLAAYPEDDDTGRHEAECESRFRQLTDSMPQMVWMTFPDGRHEFFNRRWYEFTGVPEGSTGGPGWPGLFHPEDELRVRTHWRQHRHTGVPYEIEYRLRNREGEYRWFLCRGLPVRDASGEITRWVGTCTDIDAFKRLQGQMTKSEERFRKVFEHAATGIAITNFEGRYEQCNPAYCALVGYTEEELRGMLFPKVVHPDDVEANAAELRRLQNGEFPHFEIENRYLRKDGTPVWVRKFVSVLRGNAGVPAHFVALVTDVTEQRSTETALKEAKEAAEAANRGKDRFLAMLSHELRTPLTPILMTACEMRSDQRLPDEVREQFQMIERNVALEARLIDDLLDLTRITRGKLTLRTEPCDLHALLELVVAMVRSEAEEKQIAITLEPAARHTVLTGDPARLQQVFWNLLRNGVKFSNMRGNVCVRTYDVTDGCDGGYLPGVCVEVRDDGVGFEPGDAARIFEPFEQTSRGHHLGGLGLGLSIARAIVQMHEGTIRAESAGPGAGATFTVQLPATGWTGAAMTSPMHEEGQAPQKKSRSMHLLLVEDHGPTRDVLERLLTRAGHRVTAATSLAEARMAASIERFDAVLSDVGLPDGTGVELMEYLRAKHGLRGIALSGYGMDEDLRHSREAGFIAHLVKPVDINELREALERL